MTTSTTTCRPHWEGTDATVTGPIAERIVWANMIDSMMMLLVGLIAVAVLIALVGVANTLSLSVIRRTPNPPHCVPSA